MLTLKWKKLAPQALIPKAQSQGAACFDLSASDALVVDPGKVTLIPTGLSLCKRLL